MRVLEARGLTPAEQDNRSSICGGSCSGADGRPILGNPLLHSAAHVEDLLVAELAVQNAACDAASPSTSADERNRLLRSGDGRKQRRPRVEIVAASCLGERQQVAAFDDARVVPLLGTCECR